MKTAKILLPVALNRTFDYLLTTDAVIGQRVVVDFGQSGATVGLIVDIVDSEQPQKNYQIKAIDLVLEDFPVVNRQWWDLLNFSSRYYVEPLGKALKNAFPKPLRQPQNLQLPTVNSYCLSVDGHQVMQKGGLPNNAVRQRRLLQSLKESSSLTLAELREQGFKKSDIDRACNGGLILVETCSPYAETNHIIPADYELNEEQKEVVANISASLDGFQAHLIEGVTGSGKTEVYMQLIERSIVNGGQVLLLVPEIGLTPQMLARFKARFGRRVATYHSGMADAQRRDVFLSAASGDLPILIGTRSAIFVPMHNLQLILIDEEHDLSYKQQEGFLYNARDLAVYRAQYAGVSVVMGSATPSLESLYNVSVGKLKAHYLKERATNFSLPSIHIVDRRGHARGQILSQIVQQQIRFTVQQGKQVLLFLNRRGFSPVMGCAECDWRSGCPACSVFQTAHVHSRQLCCHHCGHTERLPLVCPKCGGHDIYFMGAGTEKLEQQLNQQFPKYRILRLDRDKQTTSRQLNEAFTSIHEGRADIILGTQLVVKGHHFANVSMVCVVDADSALFSNDFRAEERLYQQLIQVAGRAGRESSGIVYVQSSVPDHGIFHALVRHSYHKYAQKLLAERKEFTLPPYAAVVHLKASSKERSLLLDYLRAVKTTLSQHAETLDILGPVPLSVEKIKHRYQANLWISASNKKVLQKSLPLTSRIIKHFDPTNRFKTVIDVDAM